MPRLGDVFDDVRDNGRTMRISCHPDRGAVVVSLWQDTVCRGSFRLAAQDLDRFIAALTEMSPSLGATPTSTPTSTPTLTATTTQSGSAAATGTASGPAEPTYEQTGDITGTAHFGRLVPMPAPRVA